MNLASIFESGARPASYAVDKLCNNDQYASGASSDANGHRWEHAGMSRCLQAARGTMARRARCRDHSVTMFTRTLAGNIAGPSDVTRGRLSIVISRRRGSWARKAKPAFVTAGQL